ncbi:MAG: tetratricopeptide repeat protein [Candidatus Acidiferrales bacterium]
MHTFRSSATLILAALAVVAAGARGQARVAPITGQVPGAQILHGTSPYASITVTVADEDGMPLAQQALVKLSSTDNPTNLFATTQDRSQAMFEDVLPAHYDIEVSAAGYDSSTKSVYVMAPGENFDVLVRLRRSGAGDPVGLPGQVLVGRARVEAQKGLTDLNANKLKDAQKHLAKAYKIAPGNADLNYLMAILCSRNNQIPESEGYLEKAISINSKHVRALAMLGELRLRRNDYKGAIPPLQQAISIDKQFWIAQWLLADAYLKNGEFEKSREQAEEAIQKGKGDTAAVELVLGQALANLGRRDEAVTAFEAFLQKDPGNAAAPSVRNVIAQLKNQEQTPKSARQ